MPGFAGWVVAQKDAEGPMGMLAAYLAGLDDFRPEWSAFEVRLRLAEEAAAPPFFDAVERAEALRRAES